MAIISSGVVVKTPSTTIWQGHPRDFPSLNLAGRWSSYAAIYREQMAVRTVVDKLAKGTARLPLKVYERAGRGRPEARESPYAQLLRRPNDLHSSFFLWLWCSSTFDVYGEFLLGKIRDRGGRPAQLVPLHPTAMHVEDERDGRPIWTFQNDRVRIDGIPAEDVVHVRTFNPDRFGRGVSPLESLRRTLENEDAARRAMSSFWRNGGRPSVVLTHPKSLSGPAADRLRAQWSDLHAGADNFGKTAVLEEGMTPQVISLTAEDAQYIESRKLNREEVCMVFDVPPPVVHILDHATYSNITEQMRSMYRDTMAPRLRWFEAELEHQLRASVRPGASEPDFGDDVYAEFLMDEVLRGDFEHRAEAYQKGVNSGWLTPAEVREMENLPFQEGSDRLFVNSTMVPLAPSGRSEVDEAKLAGDIGLAAQRLGLAVNYGVLEPGEARELLPGLSELAVRSLMGRLSRPSSLAEVDGPQLVAGLPPEASRVVLNELAAASAAGWSVEAFRARVKALATDQAA